MCFLSPPAEGARQQYTRTDIENSVRDQFGEKALEIYRGLDGTKPLQTAMREAGVDDKQTAEMFMWFKELTVRLNRSGVEFFSANNFKKATYYGGLSLEITEKVVGTRHNAVIKIMNLLAEMYKRDKQYSEAERLLERAVGILRDMHGNEHNTVAMALANKAAFYTFIGTRDKALPPYIESLEILKKLLGDDKSVVNMMYNVAILYDSMGRLSDAEPIYKDAVRMAKKVYGRDHPRLAAGLNNLGLLYYSSGRYEDAEPLYNRALKIYIKAYGEDHPAVATAYNNLGLLYTYTGWFDKAEIFLKKALDADEKLFGKDHANLVSDLNNLASLYKEQGRLSEAEPLFKRALMISERKLGEHPALAANYNNLALVYFLRGEFIKAEPLYKKAIAVGKKTLGENHPDVGLWMTNLALLYAAEMKPAKSHELFKKTMEIEHNKREDVFTFLPEQQKLDYMKRAEGSINALMNLTATYLKDDDQAVMDTLDIWLRWKGAVMESQQRYMDAVLKSDDPGTKAKFDSLKKVRKKLARLKFSGPANMGIDKFKKRVLRLESQKKQLEAQLSRLSKEFALEKTAGKASTAQIAALLPEDAVYIDYANIVSYDFRVRRSGAPKYVAFVLLPGEEPVVKFIDLGISEDINRVIDAYMDEIRSPAIFLSLPRPEILKEDAVVLYEKLIGPFEKYLKGKKHIFISPGGNLNLIPFEVLVSPEDKYMVEEYRISYITAGRDMVRFTIDTKANKTAVIMADPDYDLRTKGKPGGKKLSRDIASLKFPRIPATREEADAIEKILRDSFKYKVRNLKGGEAREEALFDLKSPGILHLATHGFFLGKEEVRTDDWFVDESAFKQKTKTASKDNPMFRSGIVLSGANVSLKEGGDYGVISAEKALTLGLNGTELVVLSACDTGVGKVERGEGVFGLKRAFIIAGAKSLVMSLWSVPSRETTEFMISFYKRMSRGVGKAEALRGAKLELMRKYGNPFFWGAFVLVGDPS